MTFFANKPSVDIPMTRNNGKMLAIYIGSYCRRQIQADGSIKEIFWILCHINIPGHIIPTAFFPHYDALFICTLNVKPMASSTLTTVVKSGLPLGENERYKLSLDTLSSLAICVIPWDFAISPMTLNSNSVSLLREPLRGYRSRILSF
jgi:hypothetical protein